MKQADIKPDNSQRAMSLMAVLFRTLRASLFMLLVFALLASHVNATELSVTAYSDTEYTSNARLATARTQEDIIERIGVNVLLTEKRKRFTANANFKLEQEYYLNNTFSEQTNLTTGFGLFNFDIVENFMDWRTSFTRSQVLNNSAGADTPDNREIRNVFRTGPSINYRINPASTFRMGANFIQVENSGDKAADTKRFDANASYIYQYNSITSFSLNGIYDEIIESDQTNTNDEIQNITLNVGMNRAFSRGALSINVGQNQVRSDTSDTITGNFFNILLQRDEFLWHALNASYSESISDSSIGFDSLEQLITTGINQNTPITLDGLSTLDIIKRKRFDLSLTRDIDTFQYTVGGFWIDQDYKVQNNDERSFGFNLMGRQRLQESWTAGLSYQQIRQDFTDRPLDGKNFTQTYTLDTDYQWTKDFSVTGFLAYEKRSNDKNAIREYEEFSVGVGLQLRIY